MSLGFLFFLRFILLCIYFSLKDNCFTVLCWFLLNINMNQPQVYICPLPLEPPSHLLSQALGFLAQKLPQNLKEGGDGLVCCLLKIMDFPGLCGKKKKKNLGLQSGENGKPFQVSEPGRLRCDVILKIPVASEEENGLEREAFTQQSGQRA